MKHIIRKSIIILLSVSLCLIASPIKAQKMSNSDNEYRDGKAPFSESKCYKKGKHTISYMRLNDIK